MKNLALRKTVTALLVTGSCILMSGCGSSAVQDDSKKAVPTPAPGPVPAVTSRKCDLPVTSTASGINIRFKATDVTMSFNTIKAGNVKTLGKLGILPAAYGKLTPSLATYVASTDNDTIATPKHPLYIQDGSIEFASPSGIPYDISEENTVNGNGQIRISQKRLKEFFDDLKTKGVTGKTDKTDNFQDQFCITDIGFTASIAEKGWSEDHYGVGASFSIGFDLFSGFSIGADAGVRRDILSEIYDTVDGDFFLYGANAWIWGTVNDEPHGFVAEWQRSRK